MPPVKNSGFGNEPQRDLARGGALLQNSCNVRRVVYLDSLKSREKFLAFSNLADSVARMIRAGGFLSEEDRSKLIVLARDGSVACRVTRRANALVLLHDGWSCQEIA